MTSTPEPQAAVVVTCHNDALTLGATINSICRQRPEVELVVVDDGSSDPDTLRLLADFQRDGVPVIRQDNQGQAAAAMAGFHATSAPYVMRFDSDDVLLPGAVAALSAALNSSAEADAAWGDVHTFGLTSVLIPSAPALDPWLVTYTNCLPAGGTLFRRRALAEAGGWQLRKGFEDWDLWMALAERGSTGIYVPRVIYRYRRNTSGRLAGWLPETPKYYQELRSRHETLFDMRAENRRRSQAPIALKIAITAVDGMPGLSRLARIQLSELCTRLLWGGGVRTTAKMVKEATAIRAGRRRDIT